MAKLKSNIDGDYLSNIAININYELIRQHLTVEDLSKRTGIAKSTLFSRLKEPGTMRQMEIVAIANVLKISPYKLVSQRLKYEEVS